MVCHLLEQYAGDHWGSAGWGEILVALSFFSSAGVVFGSSLLHFFFCRPLKLLRDGVHAAIATDEVKHQGVGAGGKGEAVVGLGVEHWWVLGRFLLLEWGVSLVCCFV